MPEAVRRVVERIGERASHGKFRIEKTGNFRLRVRNIDTSPLDSLFYRGVIGQDEHTAGGRFAQDCLMARMLAPPALNLESTTKTRWSDIPDRVGNAIGRINRAMLYVTHKCGRSSEQLIIDLIVREKIPKDIKALRSALDALSAFYYQPKRRYTFSL